MVEAAGASKEQLRAETLDSMAMLMAPYFKDRRNIRPSEADYAPIASPLHLVSEYAKSRGWHMLRKAGFKSRRDTYEMALEHIAGNWAMTSIGPLRIKLLEGRIPAPADLKLAQRFNQSLPRLIQMEKQVLADRTNHVITFLKEVSNLYGLYPPKSGEKPAPASPLAVTYQVMSLAHNSY